MTDFTSIADVLGHLCSKNECDRQFVNDHIKWFVENDHTSFQTAIKPLIVSETIKPGKIIIFNRNYYNQLYIL